MHVHFERAWPRRASIGIIQLTLEDLAVASAAYQALEAESHARMSQGQTASRQDMLLVEEALPRRFAAGMYSRSSG